MRIPKLLELCYSESWTEENPPTIFCGSKGRLTPSRYKERNADVWSVRLFEVKNFSVPMRTQIRVLAEKPIRPPGLKSRTVLLDWSVNTGE